MLSLRMSITVLFFQEKHAMTILAVQPKEILCAVCQGAYAESLRGRIGFDWSMTVPAASREWGRSSRKTASPKTKNNNTLALAA